MHWGSLPTTYHIRIWYADVRVCVYKYRHIHVVYMRVCHYFSPRLSYARENQKTAKGRESILPCGILCGRSTVGGSVFLFPLTAGRYGAAFGCWLYVILLFWLPILYSLLYFAYCILLLLLVYHSVRVTLFVRRYCNIYFLLLYTLVLFGSYDYDDDDDYDYNDVWWWTSWKLVQQSLLIYILIILIIQIRRWWDLNELCIQYDEFHDYKIKPQICEDWDRDWDSYNVSLIFVIYGNN